MIFMLLFKPRTERFQALEALDWPRLQRHALFTGMRRHRVGSTTTTIDLVVAVFGTSIVTS